MQEELNRLEIIKDKSKTHYVKIVELYKKIDDKENLVKQERKDVKDAKSTKYVKRDAIKKIIAAWIITVPAAAILSAAIFFMIKGFMASIQGPFKILCQTGKINNTKGHRDEDRNRCRAICS